MALYDVQIWSIARAGIDIDSSISGTEDGLTAWYACNYDAANPFVMKDSTALGHDAVITGDCNPAPAITLTPAALCSYIQDQNYYYSADGLCQSYLGTRPPQVSKLYTQALIRKSRLAKSVKAIRTNADGSELRASGIEGVRHGLVQGGGVSIYYGGSNPERILHKNNAV